MRGWVISAFLAPASASAVPRRPRRRSRAAVVPFAFLPRTIVTVSAYRGACSRRASVRNRSWQGFGDVRRQFRRTSISAVRRIDADPARVKVELAADPPSQECLGPPYLHRQRSGPIAAMCARSWCVLPVSGWSSTHAARLPARSITRHESRGKAVLLADMHLLAARAGLLGERRIDQTFVTRRDANHQRPIDLAGSPAGKGFREMARGPRSLGDQQRARCILVEAVHQLRPAASSSASPSSNRSR